METQTSLTFQAVTSALFFPFRCRGQSVHIIQVKECSCLSSFSMWVIVFHQVFVPTIISLGQEVDFLRPQIFETRGGH